MELENDSDGTAKLSKQSQLDLENVVVRQTLMRLLNVVMKKIIIDVCLNKQYHSKEYKVRFKGYSSDDM